ncbi:extracellular solute-binding protein [Pseudomonas putida S11]|nr:extracellular solute-binding protein [Pseudomonas putida S11]
MKRGSKVTGWCLVSLLSCASADSTVAAADTLGRLRQEQVLNLGFMEGFAPFSSGSDQAPEGYSIDLCQAVVAHIRELPGLAGLQVRWHSLAEPEAVRAVGNGQVDLLCTPMVETKTRRGTLDFSIPVFTSGLAALVRRDAPASLLSPLSGSTDNTGPRWRATINAGLSKHSFAVLRGTLSSRWAHERIRQLGLQSTLEEVSTYEEGVQRVADRQGRRVPRRQGGPAGPPGPASRTRPAVGSGSPVRHEPGGVVDAKGEMLIFACWWIPP